METSIAGKIISCRSLLVTMKLLESTKRLPRQSSRDLQAKREWDHLPLMQKKNKQTKQTNKQTNKQTKNWLIHSMCWWDAKSPNRHSHWTHGVFHLPAEFTWKDGTIQRGHWYGQNWRKDWEWQEKKKRLSQIPSEILSQNLELPVKRAHVFCLGIPTYVFPFTIQSKFSECSGKHLHHA